MATSQTSAQTSSLKPEEADPARNPCDTYRIALAPGEAALPGVTIDDPAHTVMLLESAGSPPKTDHPATTPLKPGQRFQILFHDGASLGATIEKLSPPGVQEGGGFQNRGEEYAFGKLDAAVDWGAKGGYALAIRSATALPASRIGKAFPCGECHVTPEMVETAQLEVGAGSDKNGAARVIGLLVPGRRPRNLVLVTPVEETDNVSSSLFDTENPSVSLGQTATDEVIAIADLVGNGVADVVVHEGGQWAIRSLGGGVLAPARCEIDSGPLEPD